MGQEESQIAQVPSHNEVNSNKPDSLENIPTIPPLIQHTQMSHDFSPKLQLPSGSLPKTYTLVKSYFYDISYHINKNEEALTGLMSKQLSEYGTASQIVSIRKKELEDRLNKISSLILALDNQVKSVTESLNRSVQRADQISHNINLNIPSFKDFKP